MSNLKVITCSFEYFAGKHVGQIKIIVNKYFFPIATWVVFSSHCFDSEHISIGKNVIIVHASSANISDSQINVSWISRQDQSQSSHDWPVGQVDCTSINDETVVRMF